MDISKGWIWTGRIMRWLSILFLLFDGIMKLIKPKAVIDGTIALGFQENQIITMGILLLIATILYIIPKTSVLGAILITGYLGGAIAIHFRIGNPLFSHTLFPLYLGILIWGGLWLTMPSIRKLTPFTK